MNARLHSPRTAQSFFLSLLTLFAVSCASDGKFDESKISQIKKGETTEADLVAMFGEPQNRSVNSDSGLTLTGIYSETKVKGESFIPYAGRFLGGTRSKSKTLSVKARFVTSNNICVFKSTKMIGFLAFRTAIGAITVNEIR